MFFQGPLSMGEGGDNLFENVAANDFLELGRGVGADHLEPFFHIDFQTQPWNPSPLSLRLHTNCLSRPNI
jgi:hypothetical protein